jgi:hypothetical protein
MKVKYLISTILLTGSSCCVWKEPDVALRREACYLKADQRYWKEVEFCKEEGKTYEECENIELAEARLKEDQEKCP